MPKRLPDETQGSTQYHKALVTVQIRLKLGIPRRKYVNQGGIPKSLWCELYVLLVLLHP